MCVGQMIGATAGRDCYQARGEDYPPSSSAVLSISTQLLIKVLKPLNIAPRCIGIDIRPYLRAENPSHANRL